jgi:hypothetical protein
MPASQNKPRFKPGMEVEPADVGPERETKVYVLFLHFV